MIQHRREKLSEGNMAEYKKINKELDAVEEKLF